MKSGKMKRGTRREIRNLIKETESLNIFFLVVVSKFQFDEEKCITNHSISWWDEKHM